MNAPGSQLRDASLSGVYRAAGREDLRSAGQSAGLQVLTVRLQHVRDKRALLRAVSATFAFPGWFGENWDALEDCLTDLSWRPEAGHLLIVEGHEGLAREVLEVFIDVLGAAAAYWAARRRGFFAVFIDSQHALSLPELAA